MTIDQDRQTLETWGAQQKRGPRLVLAAGPEAASVSLAAFCDLFARLVPRARVQKKIDGVFRMPAIIIGRHSNIAYQAVPEGRELAPFLEALGPDGPAPLPAGAAAAVAKLDMPMWLTIYVAPTCPHCPQMVRRLLALAEANAQVRLSIVDAVLFSDQAKLDQVRSVPTVVLDSQWRWTGAVGVEEILDMSLRRDPSRLSAESLRQMLESGEAARLSEMMIRQGCIFQALGELLAHERWSVRLGAMVTAEYLAEEAPGLAADLVVALWSHFDAASPQAQGDMAHVLGLVRSEAALRHLRVITAGPYAQTVREAALEALE